MPGLQCGTIMVVKKEKIKKRAIAVFVGTKYTSWKSRIYFVRIYIDH